MQCPKCAVEVAAGATFCQGCGTRLIGDEPGAADAGSSDATAGERLRDFAGRRGADEPEQDVWRGSYSSKAMLGTWLALAVGTLVAVGAGIWFGLDLTWWMILFAAAVLVWGYFLLVLAYRRIGVSYRLTSQRFFHESGVLRHVTDRVEVIDIQDVICEQGIVERLFGVGTVRIKSSDRTHPDLSIRGIDRPRDVAAHIDQARRKEQLRRSLRIDAV